MSTFKLEINCDNAAFHYDNMGDELHRILSKLIHQLPDGQERFENFSVALMDSNGNKVGRAYMDTSEDPVMVLTETIKDVEPESAPEVDNKDKPCSVCHTYISYDDTVYYDTDHPMCLSCYHGTQR